MFQGFVPSTLLSEKLSHVNIGIDVIWLYGQGFLITLFSLVESVYIKIREHSNKQKLSRSGEREGAERDLIIDQGMLQLFLTP